MEEEILEGEKKKEEETLVEEPEPTTPTEPVSEPIDTSSVEENPYVKTFTQDEVNKFVGDARVKTREKVYNYFLSKYGVKSEDELDDLVAHAQCFDTYKDESELEKASWEKERNDNASRLSQMSEEIALMKSGIDSDRFDDAKFILKGKGLDITLENIENELATHPEWKKVEEPTPKLATTRITALGNEPKQAPAPSEEELAEKLFKMKFRG